MDFFKELYDKLETGKNNDKEFYIATSIFAFALLIIRFLSFKLFFMPLGKLVIKSDKTAYKFSECLFKFGFYGTTSYWSILLVSKHKLIEDTINCWPLPLEQRTSPDITIFYIVELGFYLFGFFSHIFLDARRKDFWQMLIHHIITILLLASSHHYYCTKIGVAVIFCMDLCDVFLESAKAFNYLGVEIACSILFVFLLVSWSVLRLIVYPFRVLLSAYQSYEHLLSSQHPLDYQAWLIMNLMLVVVLILNLYWYWLILYAAFAATIKGKLVDSTDKEFDRLEKEKKISNSNTTSNTTSNKTTATASTSTPTSTSVTNRRKAPKAQ
eukprot:TRINITY_DN130_c0_g1_i1.p1 TRINITY_DN130_c0_g1~~TRINITY_DN130_c0_g1_i1.p1  ORF type:complete len:326 (+),score=109.56 TRINITY_DN130_c0_g1_i1:74-1051(+)